MQQQTLIHSTWMLSPFINCVTLDQSLPLGVAVSLPENRHEHMTPSLSTALSSRADNCEMPTLRAVLLSYLVSFTCLLTLTSHFENVHPTKAHLAYCSGVV